MKNLILTITAVTFILFACTNEAQKEANEMADSFEDWAEETSAKAENATISEWEEIESEYNETITDLEAKKENMSADAKEDFEEAKAEFNETKVKYKARIDNLQTEANNTMDKVDVWIKEKSVVLENNAELSMEETEAEWNDVKSDISQNWDNFTDETKERWKSLEKTYNNWKDSVNDNESM